MKKVSIPTPTLQIDFSFVLGQVRSLYLQDALRDTIKLLNMPVLDRELATFVPHDSLQALARNGLRGELVYAVPCVLEANPYLIGYYRLLLGFSQKEFYTTDFGVSGFKTMEIKGVITPKRKSLLPDLCQALVHSAVALVDGIGADRLSRDMLDDLTLLTVGPQLRGGANVKRGLSGNAAVFKAIHSIVEYAATSSSANRIEVVNAADRKILIEFAPDPDIVIREEMSNKRYRNIVAIEIKGGKDFSNIHNRVGEAEKSHQKAKAIGYVECWTVVNVDRYDMEMARKESPTTNKFFRLSALKQGKGDEYQDFKERIISLTGIRSA